MHVNRSCITATTTLAAALLASAACAPVAHAPEAPAAAPAHYDAATIRRGAQLAAVGNCRGCHTAPGGAPLAGGVPMHSPFGTIYSSNITPDPRTGIGRWTEADFIRAMREGVDREGHHLYPAFPYDRYTHATDEDDRAIYAYLMSQPPVSYRRPRNELAFPFNVRAGLALWKALYLERGPRPVKNTEPTLARGEYLVEGLGHCGSCHSPRNALYAERRDAAYTGFEAEGWHAYAIEGHNAAPIPWSADALSRYLASGFHPSHGIARGTMGVVTEELAEAAPEDVRAMAAYVASLMGSPGAARQQWAASVRSEPLAPRAAEERSEGAAIYRTTCAECHDGSEPPPFGGLPLSLSIGVAGESPRNLVNVVLHGLESAGQGATSPVMPGFAGALSDAQVEALVTWMRANLSDRPPWADVRGAIAASRRMPVAETRFPPGGSGADPARTARP